MAIKDVTADKIEITSCISRMFSISAATFRAIKPNKIKALIKITKNRFPRKLSRKWKIQYATSAIERMKELTDSAEKINSRRNCRNTFVTCVSDVYLFLVDKIRQNTTIVSFLEE